MPTVTRVDWANRIAGDVGLLHGNGVISDAIITGEKLADEVEPGDFETSHVFVCSRQKIFEALFPKICLSPWNEYDGMPTALFRIGVAPTDIHTAISQLIHEYVGDGYDLVGTALGMAGVEILRALHLPAENNIFANKHKEWCSELALRFLQKLGLATTMDPTTEDPQQVYNYLKGLVPPAISSTAT